MQRKVQTLHLVSNCKGNLLLKRLRNGIEQISKCVRDNRKGTFFQHWATCDKLEWPQRDGRNWKDFEATPGNLKQLWRNVKQVWSNFCALEATFNESEGIVERYWSNFEKMKPLKGNLKLLSKNLTNVLNKSWENVGTSGKLEELWRTWSNVKVWANEENLKHFLDEFFNDFETASCNFKLLWKIVK